MLGRCLCSVASVLALCTSALAQSKEAKAAAAPLSARNATRSLVIDADSARKLLTGVPALQQYAQGFELSRDADADAALRRGSRHREHVQPWTIMPSSFVWTPVEGTELRVMTGHSGSHAVLVVLRTLASGALEHIASLVVDEPDTSLAVGASDQYPKQLVWSTCYGCPGEGGAIHFGDDGRVEISYR
jgi:hypothetical protein